MNGANIENGRNFHLRELGRFGGSSPTIRRPETFINNGTLDVSTPTITAWWHFSALKVRGYGVEFNNDGIVNLDANARCTGASSGGRHKRGLRSTSQPELCSTCGVRSRIDQFFERLRAAGTVYVGLSFNAAIAGNFGITGSTQVGKRARRLHRIHPTWKCRRRFAFSGR